MELGRGNDLKKMAVFGFRRDAGGKEPERCVTSFWLHRSSRVYRENNVQIDGLCQKRLPVPYLLPVFHPHIAGSQIPGSL